MVLVQKWPFFQLSVLGNIRQQNVFYDILKRKKTPFYAIKTRTLKGSKIGIIRKGLTHGFGPKITIFPTFLFRQYRPGKCLLRYSRTKKTPFYAIKTRTLKGSKIGIIPKGLTHGFGPKITIFPTFLFRQ